MYVADVYIINYFLIFFKHNTNVHLLSVKTSGEMLKCWFNMIQISLEKNKLFLI